MKRSARVDLYPAVLEIAKLLLAEDDAERTAELLFRRVLELTGAERGFIVVREGDSFERKFDIRFDKSGLSDEQWKFSRSLVRETLRTRELIYSPDLHRDPRFAGTESVRLMEQCAVLVAPLHHHDEVFAVAYLEHRHQAGAPDPFDGDARRFVAEFAEVAALFLRRAMEREALRRRSRDLETDLFAQHDFAGIVTRDPRMLKLLKVVAQVADADATVLIRGETGSGKELIARALHLNGRRRPRPFVTLHCSALPGALLESELFGHTKGAFTGAERERAGRLAAAHTGTLLLDEVAEIAPEVQAKLLRFLQFGEIQRVGSDRVEQLDVRVLAATHQDLARLVESGRFRQDLYFRLKVIELEVPPLRERPGDISLLVEHFTQRFWRREQPPRWSARAARALERHPYPGNVRELAHVVERVCLLATGPALDVELFPLEWRRDTGTGEGFERYTHDELQAALGAAQVEVERQFLDGLLQRAGGNVSEAARQSGIQRSQLQRLLARRRKK
jgi:Nif-specific regulatory protein/two-component system response regulator HydG